MRSDFPLRGNHFILSWSQDRFSDHFLEWFLTELQSNLVICCSAKYDPVIEVTH